MSHSCEKALGWVVLFLSPMLVTVVLLFETSKYELGCATEISIAVQVAFIIAGCTHVTYYEVLKHAFGIEGVSWPMFDSTIVCIVK